MGTNPSAYNSAAPTISQSPRWCVAGDYSPQNLVRFGWIVGPSFEGILLTISHADGVLSGETRQWRGWEAQDGKMRSVTRCSRVKDVVD